jgi:hypothetical protein
MSLHKKIVLSHNSDGTETSMRGFLAQYQTERFIRNFYFSSDMNEKTKEKNELLWDGRFDMVYDKTYGFVNKTGLELKIVELGWKLLGLPKYITITKEVPENNAIYDSMTSEDIIRKAVRRELSLINETRMVTYTSKIVSDIGRNVPGMKKTLSVWSIASGSVGLFRYEDGNAYEIEVRPASLSRHKDIFGKYLTRHVKKKPETIKPEEVRQVLWMAFKETADKIRFDGEEPDSYKYTIIYNETFDIKNAKNLLDDLAKLGFGTYAITDSGNNFINLKYQKGTSDKLTVGEFGKEMLK